MDEVCHICAVVPYLHANPEKEGDGYYRYPEWYKRGEPCPCCDTYPFPGFSTLKVLDQSVANMDEGLVSEPIDLDKVFKMPNETDPPTSP